MLGIEILQSPSSQVVPLRENATFYCAVSGDHFQCKVIVSNDTIFHYETPEHSYNQDAIDKGIFANISENGNEFDVQVLIEGRQENNNTKLFCIAFGPGRSTSVQTAIANLTVVGMFPI